MLKSDIFLHLWVIVPRSISNNVFFIQNTLCVVLFSTLSINFISSLSAETKLNTFLSMEENPHNNSFGQVSRDYIFHICVHKTLKLENWHPLKIHFLLHELSADNPAWRMQFYKTLMDMCNNPLLMKYYFFKWVYFYFKWRY